MTADAATDAPPPGGQPRAREHALAAILASPRAWAMIGLGAGAGLPFSLLIGSLNAWLGEAGVNVATIGVLSWIGLAYAFKFLWAPAVARFSGPLGFALGRRRGWIVPCQIVIALCLFVISRAHPPQGLGALALAAAVAAFAAATQDISIDAWRIESANERDTIDLLSAAYQFGFRLAALVGGAGALVLAQRLNWAPTFTVMAGLMGFALLAAFLAPEPPPAGPAAKDGAPPGLAAAAPASLRNSAVIAVLAAWSWAIAAIAGFMVRAIAPRAGEAPANAGAFASDQGPYIVLATVILPALLAVALNAAARRARRPADAPRVSTALQSAFDYLYVSLLEPFAEITARLGWAALLALLLVLTYRITDSIWGPFAYPFYLGEMKYSKDEVAFASKIVGVAMTVAGVALGGVSLVKLGRMPSFVLGALFAAVTNLLYWDLAKGAVGIDAFLHLSRLDALAHAAGMRVELARLLVTISGENLAIGYASAAYLAYLSSIVNVRYAATQSALLTSLTLLLGSLGRAPLGEYIAKKGYAAGFFVTFVLGGIAVAASLAEWVRQARRRSA